MKRPLVILGCLSLGTSTLMGLAPEPIPVCALVEQLSDLTGKPVRVRGMIQEKEYEPGLFLVDELEGSNCKSADRSATFTARIALVEWFDEGSDVPFKNLRYDPESITRVNKLLESKRPPGKGARAEVTIIGILYKGNELVDNWFRVANSSQDMSGLEALVEASFANRPYNAVIVYVAMADLSFDIDRH